MSDLIDRLIADIKVKKVARRVLDQEPEPNRNLFFKATDTALSGPQRSLVYAPLMGISPAEANRRGVTGSDVLEAWGAGEMGKIPEDVPFVGGITGRGTLGLGMDIFADPLNLIPLVGPVRKAYTAAVKLAGGFAKQAALRGLKSAMSKEKWERLTRHASEASRTTEALIEGEQAIERGRLYKAAKTRTELQTATEAGAKEFGLSTEEMGSLMGRYHEVGLKARKTLPLRGKPIPSRFKPPEALPKGEDYWTYTAKDGTVYSDRWPFPLAGQKPMSTLSKTPIGARKGQAWRHVKEGRLLEEGVPKIPSRFEIEAERVFTAKAVPTEASQSLARDLAAVKKRLTAEKATNLDKFLGEQAVSQARLYEDMLLGEQALKLGTARLVRETLGYAYHFFTKSAKEIIGKAAPSRIYARTFTAKAGAQLMRQIPGGIDEINKLGRAGQLPGFEGIRFDKVFHDDPATYFHARAVQNVKMTTDARIYIRAAEQLGHKVDNLAPAAKRAIMEGDSHFVRLAITQSNDPRNKDLVKYLKQYVFDPDAAVHLDKYYTKVINPPSGSPGWELFLDYYDQALSTWKLSTLVVFPMYHARNFLSNFWNNFLADVNIKHYGNAKRYLETQDPSTVFQLGARQVTKEQIEDVLVESGLHRSFSSFLGEGVEKLRSKPIRKGLAIADSIETFARVAHFMDRVEKGDDFFKAILSVKKYLFDYNDLTAFEKVWLRRGAPFYAWTRKNLPLQAEQFFLNPQKYEALTDIIKSFESRTPAYPQEDELLYDYMKWQTGVRTGRDEHGNPLYALLGGWLPATDINKFGSVWQAILEEVGPIKAIPEMMQNRDFVLGKPIEAFPGEKERFGPLSAPIKALTGLDVGFSKRYITNTLKNIRILTELDRLIAVVGGRESENILTDRLGEPLSLWIIRFMSGYKSYPLDLQKQTQSRIIEMRKLRARRRRELREGRGFNVDTISGILER